MFIVALFNSQSVSENGLMNKEGMVCFLYTHTHTKSNLIQSSWKENPTICNNMDGAWGYWVKGNKSVNNMTYTWNLKNKSITYINR